MRHLFIDEKDIIFYDNKSDYKECVRCKKTKHISEFPKHKRLKDGLDTRCKKCKYYDTNVSKKLNRIAPIKPELCECCGKKPEKWTLDHCHKTDTIRGWICEKCNLGIGKLGDTIDGLMLAVNYLKRAERK